MKKMLLYICFVSSLITAHAQFEYPGNVYTAAEMNIKGPVRKLTEKSVDVDKSGKADPDGFVCNTVYLFDEKNRVTKKEFFEAVEELMETNEYEYAGDKLVKESFHREGESIYEMLYHYGTGKITVKEGGSDLVRQERMLENGRVVRIKYFNFDEDGEPAQGSTESFVYNNAGQVVKKTTTYEDFTEYATYVYNGNGDIQFWQEFDADGALIGTHFYEYTYDSRKNWIKCTWTFSRDPDTRTVMTRTYDYGGTTSGYRILVISTAIREDALRAKEEINTRFPELKALLVYQAPDYKVKAGNFKTREEAKKYLSKITALFPKGVTIITDTIDN